MFSEFWKHRLALRTSVNQHDVVLFASYKIFASLVGFPLGHGYFISLSFSFFSPNATSISKPELFLSFSVARCGSTFRAAFQKNTEWGSLYASDLKADVTWLPTSNGPVNCRESEIIYLWLAFSLVNVNELSTWLLSEPWPRPHGRYIIRLHGEKKHTFVSTLPC